MDSTRSVHSGNGHNHVARQILRPPSDVRYAKPSAERSEAQVHGAARSIGYGLPCKRCRTYYGADLTVCPICKSTERVSPKALAQVSQPLSEEPRDRIALEEERERFLREFKTQLYSSHMQINAAASFRCSLEENHPGGYEPAEVCKCCYDRVQERVDLMEAALHMNLREAAQIIYDAVWADTSDSSKTYQNAAEAILTELRRRAGIALVLGPLQPLPH